MDITLNDEQKLIAETAWAFAKEALPAARIRELESSENGFDPATWRQMADMGWAGAVFPDEYGGSGLGWMELALIMEALGRGAVPSPIYAAVVEAGALLLHAGSPEQRRVWLPRIAAGASIVTTALIEADGGCSAGQVQTEIARNGSTCTVNGTKLFVRDAGVAEAIICLGRERDDEKKLTLMLVPADARGISRRRLPAAGGETLWEVTFEAVTVPGDAAIGAAGGAWPHVEQLLLRGAAMKSAELVGIGQAALDLTVAYAGTRVQFGRAIGTFQAVQHHCADMYRAIAVSRLLVWQAAARLDSAKPALREIAMAKAKTSEAIPAVTRTAHQIHGAFGFYRDYPLELYYHRAIAAAAAYGHVNHQRRALARLLRDDLEQFRGDHRHELPVHHF
ncbi:MAG TPA: acyl-CoA dehydrogenase family protein [Burkholderiales bacterium]|nr:acyl-CoA dehydrogenase family protein [Burkholderiales bacterium]